MKNIFGLLFILSSTAVVSCGNAPLGEPSRDAKNGPQNTPKVPEKNNGTNQLDPSPKSLSVTYELISKTPVTGLDDVSLAISADTLKKCQTAFAQLISKKEIVANPYQQITAGEKTWNQVISRFVSSSQTIDVNFMEYNFTETLNGKTASFDCTVPKSAGVLDSRFQIDFPNSMKKVDESKRHTPDNGQTYGIRKIGGILWDSNYTEFYAYMDRILFNWRVKSDPTAQLSDELNALFQNTEFVPFESNIDLQNPCVARALQVSSNPGFTDASLFSAPDEKFCEPKFRFLSPATAFEESILSEHEYVFDSSMPVSIQDQDIPDCRGTMNRLICRRALIPSFKAVFEETLAKSKTLYVRVLLKTKEPQKFILGTLEVGDEGDVKTTSSRFISNCQSEGLPTPLCFAEFRTAP